MSGDEESPANLPDARPPLTGGPMVPRTVVAVIALAMVGIMVYSATQHDYKSMIVTALVVLFILGADLGALLRNWRGGGGA